MFKRQKVGRRIKLTDRNCLQQLLLLYCLVYFVIIGSLLYVRVYQTKLYENTNYSAWIYSEIGVVAIVIIVAIAIYIKLMKTKKVLNWLRHKRNIQNIAKRLYYDKMFVTKREKNWLTGKEEERIVEYPKIYYLYKDMFVYVRIELDFQRWQSQLIKMGDELALAMYCDMFQKVQEEDYMLLGFIYAPIQSRIDVLEMKPSINKIQLMKHMHWEYNKIPHALVTGGTGSGKTYAILSLLYSFIAIGADVLIFDPKKTDLSYLKAVKQLEYLVKYETEEMTNSLKFYYESMLERQVEFDKLAKGRAGLNYYDVGLKPFVLIFDEYSAFIGSLDFKQRNEVEMYMNQIILLGRQLGYFIVLGMQRPDGNDLDTKLRDQFGLRMSLGNMSATGYSMMFGDTDKQFMSKLTKGFGYISIGSFDVQEFYSPFVPAGFDFVHEIRVLMDKRDTMKEAV